MDVRAYPGSRRHPHTAAVTSVTAIAVAVGVADPQVHLPASSFDDDVYMLWSTDGFARIANGNASYLPPALNAVRNLTSFPDAASVQFLRSRGYRTVVLHTDRAAGTPWADAAHRPTDGLGISAHQIGPVVVYDLGS